MTAESTQVTAAIIFDGGVPTPTAGVVHVAVLDVSRVDAAAIPVSSVDVVLEPEPSGAAPRELEVTLEDVALEQGRDYIVRAHWEPRGDDDIHPGDQLTTSSVPLTAGAETTRVAVPLTRIV